VPRPFSSWVPLVWHPAAPKWHHVAPSGEEGLRPAPSRGAAHRGLVRSGGPRPAAPVAPGAAGPTTGPAMSLVRLRKWTANPPRRQGQQNTQAARPAIPVGQGGGGFVLGLSLVWAASSAFCHRAAMRNGPFPVGRLGRAARPDHRFRCRSRNGLPPSGVSTPNACACGIPHRADGGHGSSARTGQRLRQRVGQ
jgi:hypothetical protein